MSLQFTVTGPGTSLLALPWSQPLETWPADRLAALPRGLSRHVVRFVRVDDGVLAVKEIGEHLARREYDLLRRLRAAGLPTVEPLGVVTGRERPDGTPIDSALLTRHLQFSLPYRALFSQRLRPDTANRLIDALVLLLVRVHLSGFFWGDVSLSNVLFRRDAGEFAAYLVDAETGELHPQLSRGQRAHDLDLAVTNIGGELLDLQAGELLEESVDAVGLGADLATRYSSLWTELTAPESFDPADTWRVHARMERLNDLGFDVGELTITSDGGHLEIAPKVVDAGHHSRRLLRLTGLDVEENQARRLLNDLDTCRVSAGVPTEDAEIAAHRWVQECYEPVVRGVPPAMRGKLEPAEVYHEVLVHRWFRSEAEGHDVGLTAALASYVAGVLVDKPDEAAVLGVAPGEVNPDDP
jgi:hypothetical protein